MSTRARSQPRQAKGVPVGGQWRATRRAEGPPLPDETSHFAAARVGALPERFDHWDLADKNGWTVAHVAAQFGRLPAGFDRWGLANERGWTVAHEAASSGCLPAGFSEWELPETGPVSRGITTTPMAWAARRQRYERDESASQAWNCSPNLDQVRRPAVGVAPGRLRGLGLNPANTPRARVEKSVQHANPAEQEGKMSRPRPMPCSGGEQRQPTSPCRSTCASASSKRRPCRRWTKC